MRGGYSVSEGICDALKDDRGEDDLPYFVELADFLEGGAGHAVEDIEEEVGNDLCEGLKEERIMFFDDAVHEVEEGEALLVGGGISDGALELACDLRSEGVECECAEGEVLDAEGVDVVEGDELPVEEVLALLEMVHLITF